MKIPKHWGIKLNKKEHRGRIKKSDAKYKAMIAAIQSELWSTVLYAVIITLFMAVKSERFTENLINFFTGIAKVIKSLATSAFSAGMWCAWAVNLLYRKEIHRMV